MLFLAGPTGTGEVLPEPSVWGNAIPQQSQPAWYPFSRPASPLGWMVLGTVLGAVGMYLAGGRR